MSCEHKNSHWITEGTKWCRDCISAVEFRKQPTAQDAIDVLREWADTLLQADIAYDFRKLANALESHFAERARRGKP